MPIVERRLVVGFLTGRNPSPALCLPEILSRLQVGAPAPRSASLTSLEGGDETAALNFKPHFGIMNRTLSHLLRAPRLCCGISLLLATCAFGDTASRFATSDI